MSIELPEFPANACAYEIYDPHTLKPQNDSTYIRLLELGWTPEEFKGKSVLDIGANSGVLSIHAHRLGAASIHAVDVQAPLVEYITAVAKLHSLPIRAEQRTLFDLDPQQHAADIVLFMEVLHWIVDQGGSIQSGIAHVASLTRETLFFETPWDVNEPSIAHSKKVTAERYNIELIIRELSSHFQDVRIVRFMTYFGMMPNSKRVLIRASGKRKLSPALTGLEKANLLDVFLKPQSQDVVLVTTQRGPSVLKRLPADSTFAHFDEDLTEALCAFLSGLRDPTIVPAVRVGDRFRIDASDGHRYMLFPFVGQLGNYLSPRFSELEEVPDRLGAAVALRRDLRQAPAPLVARVRAATDPFPLTDINALQGAEAKWLRDSEAFELCSGAFARLNGYGRTWEDALTHSDVQSGNIVADAAGRARVVDIDWLRTGTPYSDLLICALHDGAEVEPVAAALQTLQAEEARPVSQFDFDFSVSHALKWLDEVMARNLDIPKEQFDRVQRGFITMGRLAHRHVL